MYNRFVPFKGQISQKLSSPVCDYSRLTDWFICKNKDEKKKNFIEIEEKNKQKSGKHLLKIIKPCHKTSRKSPLFTISLLWVNKVPPVCSKLSETIQ